MKKAGFNTGIILDLFEVSYKVGARGRTKKVLTRFPMNGLYQALADVKQFKKIRNADDKRISIPTLDLKILFMWDDKVRDMKDTNEIFGYLVKNPEVLESSYDIRNFKISKVGESLLLPKKGLEKLL